MAVTCQKTAFEFTPEQLRHKERAAEIISNFLSSKFCKIRNFKKIKDLADFDRSNGESRRPLALPFFRAKFAYEFFRGDEEKRLEMVEYHASKVIEREIKAKRNHRAVRLGIDLNACRLVPQEIVERVFDEQVARKDYISAHLTAKAYGLGAAAVNDALLLLFRGQAMGGEFSKAEETLGFGGFGESERKQLVMAAAVSLLSSDNYELRDAKYGRMVNLLEHFRFNSLFDIKSACTAAIERKLKTSSFESAIEIIENMNLRHPSLGLAFPPDLADRQKKAREEFDRGQELSRLIHKPAPQSQASPQQADADLESRLIFAAFGDNPIRLLNVIVAKAEKRGGASQLKQAAEQLVAKFLDKENAEFAMPKDNQYLAASRILELVLKDKKNAEAALEKS